LAILGVTVYAVPSYAELKINPFPKGENQDAPMVAPEPEPLEVVPTASDAPIPLDKTEPVTVIKTETYKGDAADVVLPLPQVAEDLRRPPELKAKAKADRERALYQSLKVPEPGSDYFSENGSLPPPEDLTARIVAPVDEPAVEVSIDSLQAVDRELAPLEPLDLEVEAQAMTKKPKPLEARMSDRLSDQLAKQGLQALDYPNPTMGADDAILPILDDSEVDAEVDAVVMSVPQAEAPPQEVVVEIEPPPAAPVYQPRHDPSKLVRVDLENKKIESMDGELLGRVPVSVPAASEVYEPPMVQASVEAAESYAPMQDWVATEGQSIRSVLQSWSSRASVELVWDSRNEFAVLDGFTQNSAYEHAVKALLDQYESDQVRPVAQLHIDPSTQERVLVVQVEGL
jgi:hypothetical protein